MPHPCTFVNKKLLVNYFLMLTSIEVIFEKQLLQPFHIYLTKEDGKEEVNASCMNEASCMIDVVCLMVE